MADLFRPAVRLLASEPADDAEVAGEAGNRWAHVWEAVSLAERSAQQLDQHVRHSVQRRQWPVRLLLVASVLALGVSVGIIGARGRWPLTSPGGSPGHAVSTPQLADLGRKVQQCRYDKLLERKLQGGPVDLCPNCRPKVETELTSVLTLCMVCHVRPGEGVHARASHESTFE
jgi:hypothetical protein